jgi:hypothetical protein
MKCSQRFFSDNQNKALVTSTSETTLIIHEYIEISLA